MLNVQLLKKRVRDKNPEKFLEVINFKKRVQVNTVLEADGLTDFNDLCH